MSIPPEDNRVYNQGSDPARFDVSKPPEARPLSPERLERHREVQALCRRCLNAQTIIRRLMGLLLDALDDPLPTDQAEPVLALLAATDTLAYLGIEPEALARLVMGGE